MRATTPIRIAIVEDDASVCRMTSASHKHPVQKQGRRVVDQWSQWEPVDSEGYRPERPRRGGAVHLAGYGRTSRDGSPGGRVHGAEIHGASRWKECGTGAGCKIAP